MKKYKHLLWLSGLVIVLISLLSLNACSLGGETIPQNRTKEQFEFEKTFEPMFKFLEQEQKDFNGLEAYKSRVYIKNGDEVKRYEIDLGITKADGKGDYRIQIGENKKTVPVSYSNGKLHYDSEIDPLFDEEILNLVVKRDVFDSLNVKRTLRTGTTELSEIIYQPENNSDLFQKLKNKYDLPEETTCQIRIDYSDKTNYGITIQLTSKEMSVKIGLTIIKKRG
ncbi:lipoprotein [Streptococcus sp. VT 162]|nr:lipoprotein [Streptococcus sp. VT 162]